MSVSFPYAHENFCFVIYFAMASKICCSFYLVKAHYCPLVKWVFLVLLDGIHTAKCIESEAFWMYYVSLLVF